MDKILICGKTGLFSREALQYITESHDVFIAGKKAEKDLEETSPRVRVFPLSPSESDFQKLFEAGSLKAVWYVTRCVDGGRPAHEDEQLQEILRLCDRYGVSRCIVLTENADPTDYRQIIRNRMMQQADRGGTETAVALLPLLTGTGLAKGRLLRIFGCFQAGKTVILDGGAGTKVSVLSMQELTAMLLRMTDETWFRQGIFEADGSAGRLEDLRECLVSVHPDAVIEYSTGQEENEQNGAGGKHYARHTVSRFRIPAMDSEPCDGKLGEMYRLPVAVDWGREIGACYQDFVEGGETAKTRTERAAEVLRGSGRLFGAVADMLVMFLIAEFLARITSESVYFKIVDVRLLFVILMGMMHGLAIGLAAAAMECVMLVIRYSEIGISGLLLFYNVENWIPFVYYLTAGVISGYTHQKNIQEIDSVKTENTLIRSKYLYLNEAYRESVSDRRELRAQILSEEESYQKLYDAVCGMSQRTPEAVCVEAVQILRRLLENDTVSVYEMDPEGRQAKLLSCCRENASRLQLSAGECPEMAEAVRMGKTWKNVRFLEGAPMYAARVRYSRFLRMDSGSQRSISLIVTIEKASQDQLSLWYMNHFTILCSLLQEALEKAALRERVQV